MNKEKNTSHLEPELTSESILQLIQHVGKPVSIDDLLKILHAERKSKKKITLLLQDLELSGKVLRTHGKWFLPKKNPKAIRGVFSLQRSGAGFVIPSYGKEDIFIPVSHMNDAWDGDTVEVVLLPGKHGPRKEGRITAILSSANRLLPVHAVKHEKNGTWVCVPLHQGVQQIFFVEENEEGTIHAQDLLLVSPHQKIDKGVWLAKLSANLHTENTPLAQEMLSKANNAIPTAFPSLVLEQCALLPEDPEEKDFQGRTDLRHLPFVTIDGQDAKDFDDAILVESCREGFRLFVAIADVAHYVKQGSAIDKEALLRGNSYYFPQSVEPMLPYTLSNTLCSLKPHVPRLVMVAEMVFDHAGKELQSTFYQAVIQSNARLTYDQVFHDIIQSNTATTEIPDHVVSMLTKAVSLATTLDTVRKRQGSLNFDIPEPSFTFDAKGNVTAIAPRSQHFAHKLIEVFMVAANESVARFLTASATPFLYRIHPEPSEDKLDALITYIKQTGLAITNQPKGKRYSLSPTELNAILDATKNTPQEYIINRLVLRAMMQAKYSTENEGHYGLGSECYCHFTSPIRRYADLVVHRALKATLEKTAPEQENVLIKVSDIINKTERAAMDAERETAKRLSILLLKDHIQEEFEGIISGVTDFGIFVEIPAYVTEGMIRLSSLTDDYYELVPERALLRGRHQGKAYALGDKVTVTLIDVSLERQEVTLSFSSNRIEQAKERRPSLQVTFQGKKSKKKTTKNTPKKSVTKKASSKKKALKKSKKQRKK